MAMMLARSDVDPHNLLFGGAAAGVAATIFAVDTFTKIEGAIAVLYVISLLLAAEAVSRVGLVSLMLLFIFASLTSFLLTHGPEPDFPTFLRLTVAMAALCVTTALLLRNDQARTELLASNAALRESEARYRSIFDRTRVALWERDYSRVRDYLMNLKKIGVTDLRAYAQHNPNVTAECIALIGIVAANEAAIDLVGESAAANTLSPVARFIPPSSEAAFNVFQAILDGAEFYEGEAEVVNEKGERRRVLLSVSFPQDPAAFNRVVVSMVDITQREEASNALAEARAELSRASKATTIGVLSASLAHELNQPLGAIVVNSQTLLRWLDRDPPDLGAVRRSAERIIRDSERAGEIIKNTRSMMTAAPQSSELIDLKALVTETLTLMEHDLQREQTTVDVVQKSSLPCISGVKVEMQQVLINLISNAAQAMSVAASDRRVVTIALDAPKDCEHISISVRDTGSGLEGDVQKKIFTPFFTTKENGMGMGLSICRSTIEARGGSLEAANSPDGGAVFEIRLPKETANA